MHLQVVRAKHKSSGEEVALKVRSLASPHPRLSSVHNSGAIFAVATQLCEAGRMSGMLVPALLQEAALFQLACQH